MVVLFVVTMVAVFSNLLLCVCPSSSFLFSLSVQLIVFIMFDVRFVCLFVSLLTSDPHLLS